MMDEPMLSALALDGETAAWNQLISRHNHRILVFLLARGVHIDRAKELAQETWIRLIEQQRQGRLDRLDLPGLAIRQATFLLLEDGRRMARVQRLCIHIAVPSSAGGDAEQSFLTQEKLTRAQVALAQCSPSAQRIFRLLYENPERSHQDVATEVGLSLQRVRQIICQVRKTLRQVIED